MFIEACLISCGLYYGSKLFEKIRGTKKKINNKPEKTRATDKTRIFLPAKTVIGDYEKKDDEKNEYEKMVDRNLFISAGSLGLNITGALFFPPLTVFGTAGVIYCAGPIIMKAKNAVFKEHRMRIAIIDSLAVMSGLIFGYYVVCALGTSTYYAAQKLMLKTEDKAKKSLVNIFGEQPRFVWLLKDGSEIQISFESMQAGDIIAVTAGEPVPADGIIIRGIASIDQHILTGESLPVEKSVGDCVFAATTILSGKLYIRVERAGQETAAAKIGEILNNTEDFKSFVQLQGEKIADKSVMPTLAMSAVAYPFVGVPGTIALLSSDFLDNMRIVAPIGMLNMLRIASQNGILIKDGRSLELLSQVDTVVFDKTGTLTLNQPHVRNIFSFNGMKEDMILAYAALAESRQTHPIAMAILSEAGKQGLIMPEPDETAYKIGYGVTVKTDRQIIRVGSARFMETEGIQLSDKLNEITEQSYEHGYSLVYMAVDNRLEGAIELAPTVRPEAAEVIRNLRQRNISVCIISGDHEKPTLALSRLLGIDDFFAEVLPNDKAVLIEELRKRGRKVCFVGDGINDAIALKKAHASISISGASAVATDTAQVILMDQSLKKIPYLFDIADKFKNNMLDTLYVVCVPGIICIGGVFFLNFGLLAAVLLYNVSLAAGASYAMLPWIKEKSGKGK